MIDVLVVPYFGLTGKGVDVVLSVDANPSRVIRRLDAATLGLVCRSCW